MKLGIRIGLTMTLAVAGSFAAAQENGGSEDASGAGESYNVRFECTNGTFVVEVHPDWAPKGAARFKEAVKAGVYDNAAFFRVLPGFVVQFGIPGDPEMAQEWSDKRIEDDPVKKSNEPGTITFATAGADTRTTQVFINTGDQNTRLDDMGFAPFGEVVEGMDVVRDINDEYLQKPDQSRIKAEGNAYLKEAFPNLDYIKNAEIVDGA